jgi:hypothetical protein
MEVHAHSHTERKKWTHYFWEFLMLFLAVFCGFLAENFREHQVEYERAKGLAKNLYKEIYADSIAIQQKLAIRNKKEEECIYFINYVKDSNLINLSPHFYSAFTWAFIQTAQLMFDPNDGIMNQLRNSGELRYFKNSEFQSAIGNLSVMIANVRSRNEREYSYVEFYLRPFTLKHYDFNWYDTLTQHGNLSLLAALNRKINSPIAGRIVNADKFNRQEAQNIAYYYLLMLRSTRQAYYLQYVNGNHQLLEILRKEYHIE